MIVSTSDVTKDGILIRLLWLLGNTLAPQAYLHSKYLEPAWRNQPICLHEDLLAVTTEQGSQIPISAIKIGHRIDSFKSERPSYLFKYKSISNLYGFPNPVVTTRILMLFKESLKKYNQIEDAEELEIETGIRNDWKQSRSIRVWELTSRSNRYWPSRLVRSDRMPSLNNVIIHAWIRIYLAKRQFSVSMYDSLNALHFIATFTKIPPVHIQNPSETHRHNSPYYCNHEIHKHHRYKIRIHCYPSNNLCRYRRRSVRWSHKSQDRVGMNLSLAFRTLG
jgi:hypothetical protein